MAEVWTIKKYIVIGVAVPPVQTGVLVTSTTLTTATDRTTQG